MLSKHQYDIIYERYYNKLQTNIQDFADRVVNNLHKIPHVDSIHKLESMQADMMIDFTEIEGDVKTAMGLHKLFNQYFIEPRNEALTSLFERVKDEYNVATNAFTGRKNALAAKSRETQRDLFKRHSALKEIAKTQEHELFSRFEALKKHKGGQQTFKKLYTH